MITKEQKDLFEKSIIAQDDDNDYSESGWVAVVVDNWAAISRYSHCSCFGTWDDLTDECSSNPRWDWQGTVEQLVKMAQNCADPAMPKREANKEDYDYDHLSEVYRQVLEWDKKRKT
jgi:hypothetical protein